MLKRIRKISKQKASGKEQEELAAKSKPDKTAGDMTEKTAEMTTLLSERDSLLEKVKNLQEQLQNESVRYAELKSLKTQQVCTLTFKLAKAMRDKERAIEENESLKQELQLKRNTRQEHEERGDLENRPETVPLDVVEVKHRRTSLDSKEPEFSTKEIEDDKSNPLEKMSCFAITGEPIQKERVQEEIKQELVEKSSSGGGESKDAAEETLNGDENSDCSSDALSLSQCSFKSDDQNAKKKVMIEFRRIQRELRDVKKNMAMVQGLNEQLSRDLQSLVDKKNSHPLARSQSPRMRRNKSSDFPTDSVDGKKESTFVFPATETADKPQAKTTRDISTETEVYAPEQLDGLDKKSDTQDERIEYSNQKSLERIPDDVLPVELEPTAIAQSQNDDQARQANGMEVRKQLEKAMKELEELRADNKEMKEKIKKTASSTDHDFLRKTTQFTGALLKEMRERELKIERKMYKTMPKVERFPLNVLGTRLNEISKTVDDMTESDSTTPPLESVCVTSTVESALMTEPIPRPQSAGLPTTNSLLGQENAKPRLPFNEQKKRRFPTGKLGEPSLRHGNFGRLTHESGLKKSVEPLAKEWRSTENLSPRSSFSGSLGYKDYIQRHIVLSSNAIAKIRDLTPEEVNGRIIY